VQKEIALQVGELLNPGPPYFNDFIPLQEFFYRTITTTMETYSYTFTMTQNNPRGGILFGLGKVNQKVNATMYFDNISIEEVDLGDDEDAPVFTGVSEEINLVVDAIYDPLTGVSAYDEVDGDLTDAIEVEILDAANLVVSSVDTSEVGEFTVNYSVSDEAGNTATASTLVTIVEAEEGETYPLPEWRLFANTWEGSAANIQGVNGQLVMTVNSGNFYQNHLLQIIQDAFALGTGPDNAGSIQFEAGKTYKVSLDAKASIAGNINLAIGHAGGGFTGYKTETLAITTSMKTFTVEFTLDAAGDFSTLAQFKLEMGTLFNQAPAGSTFVLDNVKIEEKVGEAYVATSFIQNGSMTMPSL
jgi:hypothetical protein